ncbi:MAG TPA: GNAT family N-acetyltransferase [Pyrinomonadaceae bacterium]|nr:GNAT family N-acetyltransferase [Pyrinomonadaceae bacterium]
MVSNTSQIQFKPLKTIEELKTVEELQLEVWGCSEREVLPSLALIPLLDIGGILIGAFDGQELVGFVFGFPGLQAGTPLLHSDMLAVKGEYRSSGLGYKLKLAQREAALQQGIELITWTFDPLQSTNAHLNFRKLGVTADRYKINYYGETSSVLHRTGTDRLWVTWLLRSERVIQRINASAVDLPAPAEFPALVRLGADDEPVVSELALTGSSLTIEIPNDINTILKTDEELAKLWRDATRAGFTAALAADYLVAEFFRDAEGKHKGVYLLTRNG